MFSPIRCKSNSSGASIRLLPSRRRFAGEALEDRRKMRLRAEANRKRDVDERHRGIQHSHLGLFNALEKQVFVRPEARRNAKLRGKVHLRKARHRRHVAKADGPVDVAEILLAFSAAISAAHGAFILPARHRPHDDRLLMLPTCVRSVDRIIQQRTAQSSAVSRNRGPDRVPVLEVKPGLVQEVIVGVEMKKSKGGTKRAFKYWPGALTLCRRHRSRTAASIGAQRQSRGFERDRHDMAPIRRPPAARGSPIAAVLRHRDVSSAAAMRCLACAADLLKARFAIGRSNTSGKASDKSTRAAGCSAAAIIEPETRPFLFHLHPAIPDHPACSGGRRSGSRR